MTNTYSWGKVGVYNLLALELMKQFSWLAGWAVQQQLTRMKHNCLCLILFVLSASSCFGAEVFPANTAPAGACLSGTGQAAQRRTTNEEQIRQILRNRVVPAVSCQCGGSGQWTRIAYLNMSDPAEQCPSNWTPYTTPVRGCGRSDFQIARCDSAIYPSNGRSYSRVCGRVIAYQNGLTDAFASNILSNNTIEDLYMDGVSLTHGAAGSRQHIWSFAVALNELQPPNLLWACSCSDTTIAWPYQVPSFVGNNHFCDSGNTGLYGQMFYSDNPMFDGEGCGPTSSCCTHNNPPWFCTTLPQPTTDNLELRLCLNEVQQEDIVVSLVDIYVQ